VLAAGNPSSSLSPAAGSNGGAGDGKGRAYLPTAGEVEEMLGPLESRCFTYLPSTWTEGNRTLSKPFVFQWCHKGRSTVRVEGGRMPPQLDFGMSDETTVTLGPAIPGLGEKEDDEEDDVDEGEEGLRASRFFPAVAQH
ncbi:unnamed protein product, partial [Ectocarpus sp. 13 AM-2016]